MFNVKPAVPIAFINACAICEHRHPSGCNYCDLDVTAPPVANDGWWEPEAQVQDKVNVASGEDVYV